MYCVFMCLWHVSWIDILIPVPVSLGFLLFPLLQGILFLHGFPDLVGGSKGGDHIVQHITSRLRGIG